MLNIILLVIITLSSLWQFYIYKWSHKNPTNLNYFTIFQVAIHTAIGEEFVYRIFPALVIKEYIVCRFLISIFILPFFTFLYDVNIMNFIFRINHTFRLSIILLIVENFIGTNTLWYIMCCLIHIVDDFLYFYFMVKFVGAISNGFIPE